MGRRYGSLPDPYVPEVAVPDFGKLESRALSNALGMARFEEAGREIRGKTALDDALKRGLTEPQALDDISQGGHGSFAMALRGGAMDRQGKRLDLMNKSREMSLKILQDVNSDESARATLDYIERELGSRVPDEWRAMPWQKLREQTAIHLIGPEANARLKLSQNADARAQALMPGQLESQRLGNENTRSILDQRREEGPLRIAEREAKVAQLQREKEGWQTIHKETDPVDGRVTGVLERNAFTGKYRRIDPATGQEVPFGQEQAPQGGGQGKQLDQATAQSYVQKAGGDKNKAREMARRDGYTF